MLNKSNRKVIQPDPRLVARRSRWQLLALGLGLPVLVLVVLSGLILFSSNVSPEIAGEEGNEPTVAGDMVRTADTAKNPSRPQSSLKRMTVVNAAARQAVCNDGTPAVYYFRPGMEEFKDKWVFHVEGGGSCLNPDGCIQRRQEDLNLTTSKTAPASLQEGGILSLDRSKNRDFYGWNHVKLNYCSSDTWVGDIDQTINGEVWYFRGKNIVRAIIEDLQQAEVIQTANLSEATEVIWSGSSAGGGGAAQNLDMVAGVLPQARVVGLIDSSWGIDIEPYFDLGQPSAAEVVAFQKRTYDESCTSDFAAEPYRCSDWEVVQSYFETPTFHFINQRDHKKLEGHGAAAPYDPAESTWIQTVFRPAVINSLGLIESSDGVYSPNQTFHIAITNEKFFQPYIENTSVAKVFGNWYFGRSGPTRLIED